MNSYLFEYNYFTYSSDIPHYRNLFNGQEADNEVYGDGAVLGYEFRQYDARIGRWWSVDPLADKYPGVGPYVFCADSPMMLVDPSGKDAWKPEVDAKGNILAVAEPGDNMNSFTKFMGPAYSDDEIKSMYGQISQDGVINLTKTYGKEFQIMTDAINDARKDPFFAQTENYNCWGSALALMRGEKLYGNGPDLLLPWSRDGVGMNSSALFDLALDSFTPISPREASVGKTLMRYGLPQLGKTTHASIFLGVDNYGNEYTFSKNGWKAHPAVFYSNKLGYGSVMGRTIFESGYYINR